MNADNELSSQISAFHICFIKYYKIRFSLSIYLLQILLCQEHLKKKNLNKVFKALCVKFSQ